MSRSPQKPRRARVTIVDIAREVGVSPATVSNALSGRRYVDADTRERVKAAVRLLGYTPNISAQRLRTGRSEMIALFSSMPFAVAAGPSQLGFLMEIAAVAAAAALERGMALVLVPPTEKSGRPIESLSIDGAILVEPASDDPDVVRLRKSGLPIVSIGRLNGAEAEVPYVDLRSAETVDLLLNHLDEQGARHIALVLGASRRNSYIEAESVYRDFARARGTEPIILLTDESDGEEGAYRAIRALLAEHPRIDGLCVPVDAFAVGANRAAAEAGLRVPEDIRIVTRYDGLRARQCRPMLTAVDLSLDIVAAQAVDLLLDHLRQGDGQGHVAGPRPTLIPRGSSVIR